jgi:hypothetical protein
MIMWLYFIKLTIQSLKMVKLFYIIIVTEFRKMYCIVNSEKYDFL